MNDLHSGFRRACAFPENISHWAVGPLLALFFLLAASPTQAATTLFETGFDTPAYSTGSLPGQDGWMESTVVEVQNAEFLSGTQAATRQCHGNNWSTPEFPAHLLQLGWQSRVHRHDGC